MKKNYTSLSVVLLPVALFLFSCQKHVATPGETLNSNVQTLAETSCKPAVFGVYIEGPFGNSWTNLAQKWYNNDKLTYLKAQIGIDPGMTAPGDLEPTFKLDWGEVTYANNQVYLRDVYWNTEVMRVSLDAQGRPTASYYHNETHNARNTYEYDTTYYYYTGMRLDSIISLYRIFHQSPNPYSGWQKYRFTYDEYGNVTVIDGYPFLFRVRFMYDYTKPIAGVMTNYHLTMPFKLMDFMELVKLPMHHAPTEFALGFYTIPPDAPQFNILARQEYSDYVLNSQGLVHSYVARGSTRTSTFYNGWDCGTGVLAQPDNGRQKQGISSLTEFKALYPFK